MPLPEYVERTGKQVYRQPFVALGVDFYGFALKGDNATIQQRICNRYLNDPAQGATDFVAIGSYVLLVFNRIASLRSTTPPDDAMGWFAEMEAAIWVLVLDTKRLGLFWFHPYMFVDNSYALSMGREIYGFPESLGWFDIPTDPTVPDRFALETVVVPTFTAQTEGRRAQLFEVTRTSGGAAKTSRPDGTAALAREVFDVLNADGNLLDDLRAAEHLVEDLLNLRVPMAFLKQFRDVVEPTRACYQAVVEVPAKMTQFIDARLYGDDFQVDITDYASHPVRTDLGLAPGPLQPAVGFWTRFDFEIGNGTVVWQAP